MQQNKRIQILLALFFLSLAIASSSLIKANLSVFDSHLSHNLAVRFLPQRIRSLVAALLWSRADYYHHLEPNSTSFSNVQNISDMAPLFQTIMLIMPEELAAYQLYARNLSRFYAEDLQARQILQQAIINNKNSQNLHELYASIAFITFFSMEQTEKNFISTAKYLNKAIEQYSKMVVNPNSLDPAYHPDNYYLLLSRVYLELNEPEKALAAYSKANQQSDSRIGSVLSEYQKTKQLNLNATLTTEIPVNASLESDFVEENLHKHSTIIEVNYFLLLKPLLSAFSLFFLSFIIKKKNYKY